MQRGASSRRFHQTPKNCRGKKSAALEIEMKSGLLGLIVAGALALSTSAEAGMHFVGSGTWDTDQPTTPYSTPGKSWFFSFDIESPLPSASTTAVAGFAYLLDGAPIAQK